MALAAVCIIGLAIIAENKGDFGRRIERPGWSENNAFAALRTPVLAALRNEMGKHLDVYRYHAPSELIPPNLGNVEFALGSHGHRSTRTIKYHDYFDFNPTGERLRNLGVRWWVTKEKVADLREVWSDGEVRIYERADALTMLWTVDATGRKMAAAIKDVQWSQNRVTFGLDRPLVGTVFFAQAFYPGFRANTEHGPEEVREADSLMRTP